MATTPILNTDEIKLYMGGLNWDSQTEKEKFLNGDGSIASCNLRASMTIEEIIDNVVVDTQKEMILDGSGCAVQRLPYWPIIGLTNSATTDVAYRDDWDGAWTDLVDDVAKFYFSDPQRADCLQLVDGSSFPRGTKNLRIRWRAGWTFDAVPARIREVALQMCAWFYHESALGDRNLGKLSVSQAAAGGSMTTSYADMRERWMKELTPWRKLV